VTSRGGGCGGRGVGVLAPPWRTFLPGNDLMTSRGGGCGGRGAGVLAPPSCWLAGNGFMANFPHQGDHQGPHLTSTSTPAPTMTTVWRNRRPRVHSKCGSGGSGEWGPLWSPWRGSPLGRPIDKSVWEKALPLLIGIIFELLYLFLIALAPLPQLHLHPTPLITGLSWTLALSHLLFSGAWNAANHSASGDWPYILSLAFTFLALAALHLFTVGKAFHRNLNGENSSGSWYRLLWLLIGATIFGLTLLLQPAIFSDDVFRSIISGRMLTIYHVDAMTTAPAQFPHDPYISWISQPNIADVFGPLWIALASVLVRIGGTAVSMLLLFKGMTLLFHLLNCILLWAILGKIAPARRFLGTLLYAWNPLALIEIAGNGHNEAVLICLLLLATWLHVQNRGRWYEIGALALFGLATTINFIALLVVAMYIWFIVRRYHSIVSVTWHACWRALVVLSIVVLIYAPFWHGPATYLAITSSLNMEPVMFSFVNILATPLRAFYNYLVQSANLHSSYVDPQSAANATILTTTIFIFALLYFYLLTNVRKARTTTEGTKHASGSDLEKNLSAFDILITGWCIALEGFVILVSGAFWPYFVLWTLWTAPLRQLDALSMSILLFSYTALFIYPLLDFRSAPVTAYGPVFIFGIPLVYLLVRSKRRKERKRIIYGR
jgi:hypothetical protein